MKIRWLSLLIIPAIAACGEPPPAEPTVADRAADAAKLFRGIFNAGEYERIPEAEAALRAVYEEDPNVGETAMLLGTLHFWSASEWGRDASRGGQGQYQEILKMEQYLIKANELDPNDGRVVCWLGGAKLFRGRAERNQALVDEGVVLVNRCAEMYPQFGLIMVGFIGSHMPTNHPLFAQSVNAIWRNVDVCINQPFSRTNPDFTPYLPLTSNLEKPYFACWNSHVAPHNMEGFWLMFGDVLVKNGQPDVARIIYNNAKLATDFNTWRYRDYLFQQIETADQRAALYQDGNPANDPPVIPQTNFQCVSCHSK